MAASVNQDDLLEVLENEEGDTNSGESGEEDGTDADSDEESDGDDGEDVAGVDIEIVKEIWRVTRTKGYYYLVYSYFLLWEEFGFSCYK